MLVVAVGVQSEWGRTMALVATEAQPTPLQVLIGLQHTHLSSMHASWHSQRELPWPEPSYNGAAPADGQTFMAN